MNDEQKTILLVDDEPTLSDALAATLESRGFECITATNMTDGIEALRSREIRVLVTDIMMPAGPSFKNVDASVAGFYLVDFAQKQWPEMPIVCLSVIGDQNKIRSLIDRGVRYLRKGETPLSTAVEVISAVAARRRIRL